MANLHDMKTTKNVRLAILALALCSATGCEERRYDAEARTQTGELIGKWPDVSIVKGSSGWIVIETRDGKRVLIEGPHVLVQR